MKYFKKIEGEQVYLSPMNMDDILTNVKWMNDFNITDKIASSTKQITIETETNWLDKTLKSGDYEFAIIRKSDDKLIGNCGFSDIKWIHQSAEVGIFIGEIENRSKGYGSEALKLLISYGFNYLNFNNIMLKVFSFNDHAINVYKKVGFNEFGRRKKSYYLKGKWYDDIYMEILREDFFKD